MKRHRYLSDRSGCLECGRDGNDPIHFPLPKPDKVISCFGYHAWGKWIPFAHGRIKICLECSAVIRQTHVGWTFMAGGPL